MTSFQPLVFVVLMLGVGLGFCNSQEIEQIDCKKHSECPDHLTCFRNFKCQDFCFYGTSPNLTCGSNAKCIVRNHLPGCACLPGFKGDAKTGCEVSATGPTGEDSREVSWEVSGEDSGEYPYYAGDGPEHLEKEGEDGCKNYSDCPDNQACFVDGICRDPCIHSAHGLQCTKFEVCRVINHRPVCQTIRSGDLFGRRK